MIGFDDLLIPEIGAVAYDSDGQLGLLVSSFVYEGRMIWSGLKIVGIEKGEFEGDLDGCLFYDTWRSPSPRCIGYVSKDIVSSALRIANTHQCLFREF